MVTQVSSKHPDSISLKKIEKQANLKPEVIEKEVNEIQKGQFELGMVMHICNPSTQVAKGQVHKQLQLHIKPQESPSFIKRPSLRKTEQTKII